MQQRQALPWKTNLLPYPSINPLEPSGEPGSDPVSSRARVFRIDDVKEEAGSIPFLTRAMDMVVGAILSLTLGSRAVTTTPVRYKAMPNGVGLLTQRVGLELKTITGNGTAKMAALGGALREWVRS